jgi:single-strand DNA-binding protein
MAKSLNKAQLIGHLGKDPELKYTQAGTAVCSFSIATNESWKDQEGNIQERTEWHNIVAWRKLAEICGEWLKKGKRVYIEGRMQTRSYEKDGVKKYIMEIVAEDMIMLDGGTPRVASETEGIPAPSESTAASDKTETDLPF